MSNVPWVSIEGFPDYLINDQGDVWSIKQDKLVNQRPSTGGALVVNLKRDGVWHTRSVKVLVAKAFVPNKGYWGADPKYFDVPIQLDCDKANVQADNLRWRPRWFAWEYHQQWNRELFPSTANRLAQPVIWEEAGIEYPNCHVLARKFGLLFRDIEEATINTQLGHTKYCFPYHMILVQPDFDPDFRI